LRAVKEINADVTVHISIPAVQDPLFRLGLPTSAFPPRPSRLVEALKAFALMGLILLTLGLFCARSAHAQSGYPDSGPTQDPGHYWKITYSQTGTWSYTYYDSYARTRTPQSGSWGTLTSPNNTSGGGDGHGYSSVLSGLTDGTVTATLTWVPAAGNPADPPSSPVHIKEYAKAGWAAAWDTNGSPIPLDADYTGTGADDGLGDPVVYGTSQGTHLIQRDGSSGTIVLTCSLYAHNPASVWKAGYPGGGSGYPGASGYPGSAYGDWTWSGGGLITTNFSVSIDDKQRKVTVSCPTVDTNADGGSQYRDPPLTGPTTVNVRAADGTLRGDTMLVPTKANDQVVDQSQAFTYRANLSGSWDPSGTYHWYSNLTGHSDSGTLPVPDFTVPVDGYVPFGSIDHLFVSVYDSDGAEATGNYRTHFHAEWEPIAWPPDGPAKQVSTTPDPEGPGWPTYPYKKPEDAILIRAGDPSVSVSVQGAHIHEIEAALEIGIEPIITHFGFTATTQTDVSQSKLLNTSGIAAGYVSWAVYRPVVNRTKGRLDHYAIHGYTGSMGVWAQDEQAGWDIVLFAPQPQGTAMTDPPATWQP